VQLPPRRWLAGQHSLGIGGDGRVGWGWGRTKGGGGVGIGSSTDSDPEAGREQEWWVWGRYLAAKCYHQGGGCRVLA
jgi:hypothetical protein